MVRASSSMNEWLGIPNRGRPSQAQPSQRQHAAFWSDILPRVAFLRKTYGGKIDLDNAEFEVRYQIELGRGRSNEDAFRAAQAGMAPSPSGPPNIPKTLPARLQQ